MQDRSTRRRTAAQGDSAGAVQGPRAPSAARGASRRAAKLSPGAHDVRVGPLAPLSAVLRELGQDPAPVFAAAALTADAFDDPERRLPFRTAAAVLLHAARATRRDDIGMLLGARFQAGQFGLLGGLMRRARTVGEALHDLCRFFQLQDRGAAVYLNWRGSRSVALGYSLLDANAPGIAQVYDLAITIGMLLLRSLAGAGLRADEVHLVRSPPPAPVAYRRAFGAPVVFGAPHSEIRFASRWLDAPVVGSDGSAHAAAQRLARSAESALTTGLIVRAQAAAQVLLAGGGASAQRLADAFGVHERTLRRRLAQEGSSFAAVIAAARFEIACQLLRETGLPLAVVAETLCYADAPAFVRAFRGWAGCTPGQWRATHAPAPL